MMSFSTFFKSLSVVVLVFCCEVFADISKNQNSTILIKDLWIRPSRLDTSAAYMVIENKGSVLDQLLSVSTDVCDHVELHRIEEIGGVFHMRPVESIEIPSGTTIILKPGGMHVMFMQLHQPLNVGEKINLTFVFKKAGSIKLQGSILSNGFTRPTIQNVQALKNKYQ